MILKRVLCRTGILFTAAVVLAAFSTPAQEGAESDLERLYDEFNEISLDTSRGFAVKNLLLEHDSFSATLEDGIVFFSNKIGDQLYAAVFLGKGKMTLSIPEPVKDMQFRNILWGRESEDPSKKGIEDQPFGEAFLVVPQDMYELLSGKYKVPGSEVTAVTEGGLLEKHRERAQELFAQQAGPPDWREIPVRAVVWRHLNNFPNEHFEFRANAKDFRWVRFRFNPDFERECRAGRISYEAAYGRQQVIEKGGVSWDRRRDYRQDKGGWTVNLRERLHEDRRTIEIFHYDMDITVESEVRLENKMTVHIRPRREGVRCARFDFLSHWQDDKRKAFIIKKCTDAEGNPLPFLHDDDELLVGMGKPLEMEKDYMIALEYEAKFDSHLLCSSIEWYPQVGGVENEATYDVKVRVPFEFIAAASGTTVKRWQEEPDYECLHTRLDKPAPAFCIFFERYRILSGKLYGEEEGQAEKYDYEEGEEEEEINVAEYAEKWGNPTINIYMPIDQQRWRSSMLALVRNILHYYNEFFQMPCPYDEIDVYQRGKSRWFSGRAFPGVARMVGGTHVGYSDISGLGEKGVVAHELGHLWWPFVTGMRNYEQDAWLSEGFAEYVTGLCFESFREQKEKGTGFKALCEEAENEWLIGPAGGFYGAGVLNLKPYEQASIYSPSGSYQTQAYRKGPYVLHMLRNILGPELFQSLLQRFLKDFAGKQPVTPDFIDTVRKVIFEYVKGEPFKTYRENETPFAEWSQAHRDEFLRLSNFYKNLNDWFEDWYVDPGHAKIRFSWSVRKDAGSYVFTGRIRQDPDEFKMVLAPITLRSKKDSTLVWRFVDKPDYEFQLRFDKEPTEVVFDEFKTLAAEVTVETAEGTAQP